MCFRPEGEMLRELHVVKLLCAMARPATLGQSDGSNLARRQIQSVRVVRDPSDANRQRGVGGLRCVAGVL
jgi:hypothetical protein